MEMKKKSLSEKDLSDSNCLMMLRELLMKQKIKAFGSTQND
jgi:ATP-dependent helicase/DNAse subunit B